ncbi:hypothetical protein RSOLAG22IIIB_05621 [Rhizoctonia solani]|uniref:Chitin-binding type-2 domain-containing protein n=1 Tax=Rhizoctonia solani TaxID=456999 RepID=A0A0K6G8E0_9AGAM|nr:hypothetical protein RSOLAG22IIIB_05621 [Rhizoctonia solani]
MVALKLAAALAACASAVTAVPTHGHKFRCDQKYFWFGPKSICLWIGIKNKCAPPAQQNCGRNWYWHQDYKYCVPSSPTYGDAGCNDGWIWDDNKYSCVPALPPAPAPGQCQSNNFYWGLKSTCLPYGGDSNPPSPPYGSQCPDNWYWRSAGHCAPRQPYYGNPECSSQYSWNKDTLCCTKGY